MYPSPGRPALGSFVRDQVQAIRRRGDVELEVFAFAPGGTGAWLRAGPALRRRRRRERFDVVHAHFGLTMWPALAAHARRRAVTLHGTDLVHPRSRLITTGALPFQDLVATVSEPLARSLPRWAVRGATAVLPCGVDLHRFGPLERAQARRALGLEPDGRYLLFPADPSRPEKRYDRARQVAGRTSLLTLGQVDPARVPLWVNAADAVVVPSEREGFGLAVLEALACEIPVLATPVGIAPEALAGVPGTFCEPFDPARWTAALERLLAGPGAGPGGEGRRRAEQYSSDRMAARLVSAWRGLLGGGAV